MPKVYEVGPISPSGHGTVFRGHLKNIIDSNIDLTVRTQVMGWNRKGLVLGDQYFDTRLKNKLMNSERFNESYLTQNEAEYQRRNQNIFEDLGKSETVDKRKCIIRDFEDIEDIWHFVGDVPWADQAPQDEEIYTILETDWSIGKVPRRWEYYSDKVDEIWVPNEWVKKAYTARDIDNVKLMPFGVDFSYRPTSYDCEICPGNSHVNPEPGSGECLDDSSFNFVYSARWVQRKGWDRLLEAFINEFSSEEQVRLIIKTSPGSIKPFDQEDIIKAINSLAQKEDVSDIPEIMLNVDYLSDQHFFDLLGGVCDCFVMPSRGECVGISWVQAMHCGVPVITTGWSAMDEYLTDEHAILLKDYELERPEPKVDWLKYETGRKHWPPDSVWADPQVGELRKAMRRAYEMGEEEKKEMTNKAKKHVHDLFDWEKHIQKRIKRYKEISNK